MKRIAMPLLLALCLIGVTAAPPPAQANRELTKALWVWDFYEAASDSNKITQLLQFLNENDINMIFIGTRNTLSDQPATYDELIRRAHADGIKVYALVGRANWALEIYHREALAELRQVLAFNKTHPTNKFDGIQFDIEPHTLPEYKVRRGSVCYQFIQVLKKIAKEIDASGDALQFDAAIPWWFASGDNPVMVQTGGERKPLSYFVLDIVDSASIMSYRDTADRQIRATQEVTNYALKKGKKIYVGSETLPPNFSTIPNEITYHNKGVDYMNQQLNTIVDHYSEHFGFGGIAIHSYTAYKKMIQTHLGITPVVSQ